MEHHVDDLNTRVGPVLCFLYARPPSAKREKAEAENDIRFFSFSLPHEEAEAREKEYLAHKHIEAADENRGYYKLNIVCGVKSDLISANGDAATAST